MTTAKQRAQVYIGRCDRPAVAYSMPTYYRACPEHYAQKLQRNPLIRWGMVRAGESIRQDGENPCDEPVYATQD